MARSCGRLRQCRQRAARHTGHAGPAERSLSRNSSSLSRSAIAITATGGGWVFPPEGKGVRTTVRAVPVLVLNPGSGLLIDKMRGPAAVLCSVASRVPRVKPNNLILSSGFLDSQVLSLWRGSGNLRRCRRIGTFYLRFKKYELDDVKTTEQTNV